ncbi:MAG: endonuclease/exonuclease/phosphatase family protein [Nitrosopumilus sp.]|nr:endonuclease/exonuclease/phosphatase family protein [Nitrosopumilus sp.]MDH3385005.1 endonuclease/exonuclease/phosphatase family protein [Nitrosopumilus sp.]
MFHGNISPEIAKGIRILRQRIKIDEPILDKTLNIATWNIREFGKKARYQRSIHYIAEILSRFDLIAIVELRENLEDFNKVMDILGPYWRTIFSDIAMDLGGNKERIAYLYDKRVLTFTGLAAEADPIRKKNKDGEYVPTITWWRSPYLASFRAGKFDFVVLTAHIRWGKNENDRKQALENLADWIEKRRKSEHVVNKDLIVMGDFNIPKTDDKLYKAITKHGLEMPNSLRGKHGSNLAKNKRYDQILYFRNQSKPFNDKGGIVDFYQDDWRALYPEEEFSSMTKNKFTYQISDHLPLWVQLDVWSDDFEIDKLISG